MNAEKGFATGTLKSAEVRVQIAEVDRSTPDLRRILGRIVRFVRQVIKYRWTNLSWNQQ